MRKLKDIMNRYIMSFALLVLTITTYADVDVRRYEKVYDCGFVIIQAKGAVCTNELDCPSISNVSYEHLSYRLNGKLHSLPTLSKQLPLGPSILQESDRVYKISSLKCQENRNVAIVYWGGGNCNDCEIGVSYSTTSGRLVPQKILTSSWNQVPFVKQYSVLDDDTSIIKWIDPPPNP